MVDFLMKNGIKNLYLVIFLLCVFSCVAVNFTFIKAVGKDVSPKPTLTIVIDAGHGGIDSGAEGVSTGVKESELNLKIANELKKLFDESGYITVMTRTDDNGLYDTTEPGFKKRDLKKRVEIAKSNNADIFISVHLNIYASGSRRGAQVFFKKSNEKAKKLADNIQLELNLLKESKRMYDAIIGDYYLLNSLDIMAVIVECGFLSNYEEEQLLLKSNYRKSLAKAIYLGTLKTLVNA